MLTMNRGALISIIIPVYNTDAIYLNDCLSSLKNMLVHNIEFIVVDDGSTNKMVDEVFNRYIDDSRFVFCRKKNGGVSSARNYGIIYILFVDSDDCIISEVLSNILKDTYDEDMICFNASMMHNPKKVVKENILVENKICGDGVVWAKLYNREFILKNNIFFDENLKYGEDTLFNIKCIENTSKIRNMTNSYFYLYRNSDNHTTTTYNLSAIIDFSNTYKEYSKVVDINELTLNAFNNFYRYILKITFYHKKCHMRNKRKKVKEILANNEYEYNRIFNNLGNIKLSTYGRIQRFLFRKEMYKIMVTLDNIVCKIFGKI